MRLRIQPMVLRKGKGRGGQYHGWRQVAWTLECDSAAEAYAVRDAMQVFFETMSRCGPKAVHAALAKAQDPAA